jgi:hypothetical protein
MSPKARETESIPQTRPWLTYTFGVQPSGFSAQKVVSKLLSKPLLVPKPGTDILFPITHPPSCFLDSLDF